MDGMLIPGLYLLTGFMAYAMFLHLTSVLYPPRDKLQMLFGVMCLCVMLFAFFQAKALQTTNAAEFIKALKWSITSALLLILLFPWFIALHTGRRAGLFQFVMSALLTISLVANLAQPFSVQYDRFEGIHRLLLPWGESITRGDGHHGFWIYYIGACVAIVFAQAVFALLRKYQSSRQFTDLSMLIAVGLIFIGAILGILARLSVINFIEPGPFISLAMVIVMSLTLSSEIRKRMRNSELHFRSLFENSPSGLLAVDADDHRILQANEMALKMTGFSAQEILAMHEAQLIHPDDFDCGKYQQSLDQISKGLLNNLSDEKRYLRKDGSSFIGNSSISALKDKNGKVLHYIISIIDVTQRRQVEIALQESEKRFRTIIEESPIGMAFGRDGITIDVNKVYLDMFGYDSVDQVRGEPLISQIAPQCRPEVSERVRRRAQGEQVETSYETIGLRKDGSQFPVYISAKRIDLNDGPLTFAFLIDITQRKKAEEEIRHLAFFDQLTHLPNRQLLMDRLHQALALSARTDRKGALLLIDLDHFKTLNDTLGYAIGNVLLQQVAERLAGCVREGDSVTRLSGDEFVVMLENLSEQLIEAAEQAEAVGEKILAALSQPYQLGIHACRSSASIGATVFNGIQQDAEELMKQVDIAMYQAKNAGRNALRFFDPAMQDVINARATLESELHRALENDQFQLYYQIQVGRLSHPVGAEALIRWIHPERGMIPPAQFIQLAEETGLILSIGWWVLETACAQIKAWERDETTRHLVLAVNISISQIHQFDFVSKLREIIARYGIDPAKLKLELTESMMLENTREIIETLNALRAIGIQLSLDDFGTGYSSLQYLKQLPLNQIKIDQSFVREIASNSNDAAIVQTIIAMAETLGLEVIAEGVETEMQREFLDLCGCHVFQGYLFGRPMPVEQFDALKKCSP